jgi:hypothetical protein
MKTRRRSFAEFVHRPPPDDPQLVQLPVPATRSASIIGSNSNDNFVVTGGEPTTTPTLHVSSSLPSSIVVTPTKLEEATGIITTGRPRRGKRSAMNDVPATPIQEPPPTTKRRTAGGSDGSGSRNNNNASSSNNKSRRNRTKDSGASRPPKSSLSSSSSPPKKTQSFGPLWDGSLSSHFFRDKSSSSSSSSSNDGCGRVVETPPHTLIWARILLLRPYRQRNIMVTP